MSGPVGELGGHLGSLHKSGRNMYAEKLFSLVYKSLGKGGGGPDFVPSSKVVRADVISGLQNTSFSHRKTEGKT